MSHMPVVESHKKPVQKSGAVGGEQPRGRHVTASDTSQIQDAARSADTGERGYLMSRCSSELERNENDLTERRGSSWRLCLNVQSNVSCYGGSREGARGGGDAQCAGFWARVGRLL